MHCLRLAFGICLNSDVYIHKKSTGNGMKDVQHCANALDISLFICLKVCFGFLVQIVSTQEFSHYSHMFCYVASFPDMVIKLTIFSGLTDFFWKLYVLLLGT